MTNTLANADMASGDPLPEGVRNTLLRRVDWRFLLPDPNPRTSICFSPGQLERGLALISDRVINGHPNPEPAPGACDLAAAVNPDRATLQAAHAALLPGGVCYTEWYSPTAGGVRGVRQRLERAGFADVTCYWAWPWPSLARTRFWIPLEAPGALGYFLTSRPAVPNRVRRLLKSLGRRLLVLVTLRLLTHPICAVARKPPAQGRHIVPMTNADGSSWLMLTGGHRSIHKVVGLVFAEPDPRPRLAIKRTRVPESVPFLMNEAAALERLHALRPGGIAGVPRLLFSEPTQAGVAVGETALVGVPLYTQLHRGNARELAYRAADWLVQLVHEPRPQPRASFWDQLVEPLLAEFSQRFGPVLDPALWERTRVILEALDHCPLACEHRDFSPWNVLIAPSGELVVHDWEGARLRGLPVLDLLYFLAHLGFFLDGAYTSLRFRQSLRQALNPATLTGSIRAEVLAHYLRRLDLDPALLAPLRVLVWLPHAAAEYQRLVADELVNPAPERLREALFPGLWEDELRDLMSLPTWR